MNPERIPMIAARCRRYGITACCDGYQSCKRTVQGHGNIRFFVADPCDQHNCYSSNSSCKVCCYKDLSGAYNGIAFHADSRCTVETEPAEPENEYTKCTNCKVMSRDRSGFTGFGIFSDTWSKNDGTDKGGTPPTICTAQEPANRGIPSG